MFRLQINHTDYDSVMLDLASQMGVVPRGNRLDLPEAIGSGYIHFLKLPNGIQASVISARLRSDVKLVRPGIPGDCYILRFDRMEASGTLAMSVDDAFLEESDSRRSVAYLTRTGSDWSISGMAGSVYQSVSALFCKEWLARYLGLETIDELLTAYTRLKAINFSSEPLDHEYLRILKEITESDPAHPLRSAIIQNRILLLVERFFSRLLEKMQGSPPIQLLSPADLERMVKLEKELTSDLFRKPLSISEWATRYNMSASKLKRDFRLAFGLPLYEYFQRARMQAAREKLITGRYSVKEVAMGLGYVNLSNFSIAFRKEFGVLPRQVISQP